MTLRNITVTALLALTGLTANAQFQLAGWDFSDLDPFGPGASWEVNPANFGLLKDSANVVTSAFEQLDSEGGTNIETFQVTTREGTTVGTAGTQFSTGTNDPQALAIFNAGVNGKGVVIEVSTKGYKSISIKYAVAAGSETAGSTAANSNQWQWSLDGQNYTNVGNVDAPTSSYAEKTYDFSAVTELNNKDKVYLRYLLNGSTATGATPDSALGLDNIQVLAGDVDVEMDPVLEAFPSATSNGNGSYTSPWLGEFNAAFFPWILHSEHGYLYFVGSANSMWLFDLTIGTWFYTQPDIYPWVYFAATQGQVTQDWHYYFTGSMNPRYFVRFVNNEPFFVATP